MAGESVRVRRAVPGDAGAMLELTRNVWEGNDYVPYVWDGWLRNPNGLALVAEIGGQLVGLQHVEIQHDGTAWLEGIRVAEDVRNAGVGLELLRHGLQWAERIGCPRARLSTYGGNPASNRLAEKGGLTRIAEARALSAHPLEGANGDSVHPAAPSDRDAVWEAIRDGWSGRTEWLYTEGWTAHSLDRERLSLLLATGSVAWTAGERPAVAIATVKPGRPTVRLGLLVGDDNGVRELVLHLRAQTGEGGLAGLRATIAVEDDDTLAVLAEAGLGSETVDEMFVYQRVF